MRRLASLPDLAIAALRSGSWLTSERLRVYPIMLGGFLALAILGLLLTSHAGKDRWGRPLGVDFSGVWVAGQEVRAGHPAQPYDNPAHAAAQAAAFGPSDSFLPWPYPPYALAIAALLAALPYVAALAVWQGGTLLLYIAAVLRAVGGTVLPRRDILVAALAFPAVSVTLIHGQNGFLSAGLLALGAFCLPLRPLLAGVLLGLLAFKPQFALAVPLAILAGRHWRAAGAATTTLVAMTSATTLAYGVAPWQAFVANLSFTRHVVLENGGLDSAKLQSAFAAIRLFGGSVALAYLVQGIVTLSVLVTLAAVWRGAVDVRLKVSALVLASLLATPYVVDYDMAMLGPAVAALVAYGMDRGFAPYEKTLLATAWAIPLLARGIAMSVGLPLGVVVMGALYACVVRRAQRDGRTAGALASSLAPASVLAAR